MYLEDLKGHWALVTGASSGIGREFALQLAAGGVNLVLVARRADRLKILAADLRDRHGIQALDLPIDLALSGAAQQLYQRLQHEGITIRLLVNSAALGHWARFEAGTSQGYEAMIRVNTVAVVGLCRGFLDNIASDPDGGAIINVSSPAAYQPIPGMAVYAATKAFVHNFSLALHEECRKQGVLVQTLLPGPTPTELPGARAGTRGKGIGKLATAAVAVRASLCHINRGTAVVITARGTLWQRLFTLLPASVVIRLVSRLFSTSPNN